MGGDEYGTTVPRMPLPPAIYGNEEIARKRHVGEARLFGRVSI